MLAVLVKLLLDRTVVAAVWLANGYCKEQRVKRHETLGEQQLLD